MPRANSRANLSTALSLCVLGAMVMAPHRAQAFSLTSPQPLQSLSRAGAVLLHGSVSPAIRLARRVRALPAQQRIGITISLRVRDEAALQRFLSAVYDPSSSSYRHFLTPREFAGRFAPDPAVRSGVVNWLRSQGLHVLGTSSNGLQVSAYGTAARLQAVFGTPLYTFRQGSESFFANTQPVRLPGTLAPRVVAVSGLSTVRQQKVAHPHASPAAPLDGYSPSQLAHLYNVDRLRAQGIDGSGQTIAIVSFGDYDESNISTFDQRYSLPTHVTRISVSDGRTTGAGLGQQNGQDEAESDIEVTQGMAPGASILMYEAPNSDQGAINIYNRIVSDDRASIVTTSWGQAESLHSPDEMSAIHQVIQEGAAQGQTFFAASGDAAAFDAAGTGPGSATTLAVDYPSSDPWVTGVGGTTLNSNGSDYAGETAWSDGSDSRNPVGSGGGLSQVYSRPDYQTGPGVSNQYSNGMRQVPDVAADADGNTGYAIYTVDPHENVGWGVTGGTSMAAPLWAAFTALINQSIGHRIGFLNPTLYALGQRAAGFQAPPFHDVTEGTNLFYPATPGWDFATGWGSFNGAALVADLKTLPATLTTPPTATPSPTPTSTPIPSPKPTAASPTVAIKQVLLLHRVNGTLQKTSALKVGETGTLIILPQTTNRGSLPLSGIVTVQQNGKVVQVLTLKPTSYAGKGALTVTVRFTNKSRVGTLLAQVTVKLGMTSARKGHAFKVVLPKK